MSSFDQKYKASLSSQLVLKIQEFRRSIKKQRPDHSSNKKNIIDDIFFRGLRFYDVCLAFKQSFEQQQKEQVKAGVKAKR